MVKVPLDAYKMDFVFSDVESGEGTYDSRGGYDYHLPIEESAVRSPCLAHFPTAFLEASFVVAPSPPPLQIREPSLYIAHIAVEMAPVAKVRDGRGGRWRR